MPPLGVELDERQKLACLHRILAGIGFNENVAGHVTMAVDGSDHLWASPWGLWWDEVRASDLCLVSADGEVLEGSWDVSPAIFLHTELHRARPDARVVVHNHPYHVCVLAAVGILPELVHQTGSLFSGDLRMVEEYGGEVDSPLLGAELAEAIGDASVAVLANHGVIVTGETVEQATYRAATIDRVCRMAYDVMLLGKDPLVMPAGAVKGMKQSLLERAVDVYWAGAVRQLVRTQPEVLD